MDTGAHRVDGGLHRRFGRQQEHGEIRIVLLKASSKREAAPVGQPQIRQDGRETAWLPKALLGLRKARNRVNSETARQDARVERALHRTVLYHQYSQRMVGMGHHECSNSDYRRARAIRRSRIVSREHNRP